MRKFLNDPLQVVPQMLEGLCDLAPGLALLAEARVVLRADLPAPAQRQVAVISGGGSGHEPAHAGYVGPGLLHAAVAGDVFTSPPTQSVLAAIRAAAGPAGAVLVVKNYTGDRLNFGLAAERARAFGHKVSMVIVDDDVALPDLPQARGVAGTLFVHKIAGALAEAGADLDTVTAAARKVIAGAASIGMSLDTCTVPGSPKEQRIDPGKAELGLGIHGEAGVEQVDFATARAAMAMVVDRLSRHVAPGNHVALLNNLGGTTPLEMSVLAEELARSALRDRVKWLVGPAAMMTSLDMHGFSVSILPVEADQVAALAAPVGPHAWPGLAALGEVTVRPLPDGLTPIQPLPSAHPARRALIEDCCRALIAAEADLNALDAKSGDGDTGSTLAGAARALIAALDRLPLADPTQLYRAIGTELSQTMGGSSGVLLAIFFAAAGDASAGGKDLIGAMQAGLERVMQVGGAKPGDRTMIDALAPALQALPGGVAAASGAARSGADRTAQMTRAKAGRASYLSQDKLAGHKDPGAEGVARLFQALASR